MSQLVPCPSCGRHVRLPSASCPFCDVAIDAGALSEQYAPRRNGVQSGIKRAMIFAVGASMAAACGGETDDPTPDPDPTVQPIYGAPVDPSSGQSDDTSAPPPGQPLYGAPVTSEEPPFAQPVYGAPVSTEEPPFAQPEYGAPVPPASTEPSTTEPPLAQPLYGAVVPPDKPEVDAGADAGVDDAGADATLEPDPGPIVQPAYGAPVN